MQETDFDATPAACLLFFGKFATRDNRRRPRITSMPGGCRYICDIAQGDASATHAAICAMPIPILFIHLRSPPDNGKIWRFLYSDTQDILSIQTRRRQRPPLHCLAAIAVRNYLRPLHADWASIQRIGRNFSVSHHNSSRNVGRRFRDFHVYIASRSAYRAISAFTISGDFGFFFSTIYDEARDRRRPLLPQILPASAIARFFGMWTPAWSMSRIPARLPTSASLSTHIRAPPALKHTAVSIFLSYLKSSVLISISPEILYARTRYGADTAASRKSAQRRRFLSASAASTDAMRAFLPSSARISRLSADDISRF